MLPLILFAAAAAADAAPNLAVTTAPVEKLHKRVVEAVRNCPEQALGEVVVCAPDKGYEPPWRLPKIDPRFAGVPLAANGRTTLTDPALGGTGVGTCSAVGAGGATGCGLQQDNDWGAWKKQQKAEGKQFPW